MNRSRATTRRNKFLRAKTQYGTKPCPDCGAEVTTNAFGRASHMRKHERTEKKSRDLSTYSPEFQKFMAEWCRILSEAQRPKDVRTVTSGVYASLGASAKTQLPTQCLSQRNGGGSAESAVLPSFQDSHPQRAIGLGATESASAGSYGEAAPCTETAGVELPNESGCSAVCDERVYTSHTAAAKKLRTVTQDGPSVVSQSYIGVDGGMPGGADCQATSHFQDYEFPQGHLAENSAGPDDDGLIPTLKSSVTGSAPESFSSELFTALVNAGGVL